MSDKRMNEIRLIRSNVGYMSHDDDTDAANAIALNCM